jgi:xylan 1,4-beta-xylosidase
MFPCYFGWRFAKRPIRWLELREKLPVMRQGIHERVAHVVSKLKHQTSTLLLGACLALHLIVVTSIASDVNIAVTNRNPIIPWMACNPAILRDQGVYYLYVQCSQIRVCTSINLFDWRTGPEVFRPPMGHSCATPHVWHDPNSGRFYLYFTLDPLVNEAVYVAEADGPLGPFQIRTKLVDQAYDGHLFCDDDGRLYLFYSQLPGHRLVVQPMSSAVDRQGEPKVIISAESDWEMRTITGGVSGPFIIKRQGRYYLIYTGSGLSSPNAAIGYATAQHPLGPYTRAAENPIMRRSENLFGPASACAITDHTGQWWIFYSQKRYSSPDYIRMICMDPIWFDEAGRLCARATPPLPIYSNPVISMSAGKPNVIRHDGVFYLYVRAEAYGGVRFIRVFTSSNLAYWQIGSEVLRAPVGRDCTAPYVWRDPKSGRFHLYYTLDPMTMDAIYMAEADGPLGPFQTRLRLVDQARDPHMFHDDDGRLYLFYSEVPGHRLVVQPMSGPVDRIGGPKVLLSPESEWETRGHPSLEGPCMIKHQGRYYLLYSGSNAGSPHSAIGYATAAHPMGPYTRAAQNPVFQGSDGIFGPSGACAIQDSAEQWWLVYNQKRNDREDLDRIVCLDPLRFDNSGRLLGRTTRNTCETPPVAGSRPP